MLCKGYLIQLMNKHAFAYIEFPLDVVDGLEIADTEVNRNILKVPFDERIHVTKKEITLI